jgi:hypothetical protein
MLKLNLRLLFSPDDNAGKAPDIGELSIDNMIDFMKDDDEKPLKLDEKEKKEEKEEKDERDDLEEDDDKDKDSEEDDENKDEEELEIEEDDEDKDIEEELIAPVRKKEILAKYPKLFKDFPYLEVAYYRDKQFTEILPTIKDAKAAVEKSEILDAFENDLLNGSTEKLLTGLKSSNPESLNKLIDNFMPTLAKVDNNAYFHIMGNVIRATIGSMIGEAKRLGEAGDPLQSAALLLNQFVFATSEYTPPAKLAKEKEKDEREETLNKREQQLVQHRFNDARTSLGNKVENVLKATIEVNIDPKGSMTDYVKKTAIRDARENLAELIDNDTRFKTILDSLWERAFKSDFNQDSLNKIRSAYLSRAKTLLPQVIKKARNEALKGLGKRIQDDKEPETKRRGPLPAGKSASSSNSGKSDKQQAKAIPRGMKSVDFLMQD